jgi:hypothetical protein
MRESLRAHGPTALLALILGVGVVELGMAASSYRSTISDADFTALATALESHPDRRVRLGSPWLDSRLRQHLNSEQRLGLASPDELGGRALFVVVATGEEPRGVQLQGEALSRERFGGLELLTYAGPGPSMSVDWLDADLEISLNGKNCRARKRKAGREWRCGGANIRTDVIEVAYRARRCFSGSTTGGQTLRIAPATTPLGARLLRGHIGFGDFNARLRSDAVADLRVYSGSELRAQFGASDDQGWRPFEVEIENGQKPSVELRISDSGTFGSTGKLESKDRHIFCLELRSFEAREGDE